MVSWPRLSFSMVVTSAEIEMRGSSVSLGTVQCSVLEGKITISSSCGIDKNGIPSQYGPGFSMQTQRVFRRTEDMPFAISLG